MRLLKFITLSKSIRLMINVAQVFSSYVVQVSLATIYILTLGIHATIPILDHETQHPEGVFFQ